MFEELGVKIDNFIIDARHYIRKWNYRMFWFKPYNYINGKRLIEKYKDSIYDMKQIKKTVYTSNKNGGITDKQRDRLVENIDNYIKVLEKE